MNILDPDNPFRYYAIRGDVVDITTEGAAEHMDKVALRYTGAPYNWYPPADPNPGPAHHQCRPDQLHRLTN